jgi:hypothetical protein
MRTWELRQSLQATEEGTDRTFEALVSTFEDEDWVFAWTDPDAADAASSIFKLELV